MQDGLGGASGAGTMLLEPLPLRQSGTPTQDVFRGSEEECSGFIQA
ncbi:hypothetical protein [Larkinella terrae]|uniref:Uncharacterized protein n=1 Tax=Larkinella terrae TaxID=2025311 RepID=A0A7K0EG14_9BACT|nr:hypothetical protein [Larkinella terrae]MRS60642.1 hypothetical protein [Larkinella terrae]